MKTLWLSLTFAGALLSVGAFAQAPAGATGQCKDGSWITAASKSGACAGHGGVKNWLAGAKAAAPAKAPASAAPAGKPAPTGASVPATTPSIMTANCKDGTTYSGGTKRGACSGHGGVKDWTNMQTAPAKAPSGLPATGPAPPTATGPAKAATPATKSTAAAPAAGGGPGQVWVNTGTKVYHCPSDRWYGKTKQGAYMSEADAKAKGYRAEGGKSCF